MNQLPNCCKKIESQRRRAWRCYYQTEELLYETIINHNEKIKNLIIRFEEEKMEFPIHFKNELLESLKDLDCPVCFEPMTKETFGLTKCFHKVCKPCVNLLKNDPESKCPICRNKI
jgi:hypothetical protein